MVERVKAILGQNRVVPGAKAHGSEGILCWAGFGMGLRDERLLFSSAELLKKGWYLEKIKSLIRVKS